MKYHRPVLVASLAVVCFCGSPCGVAIAAGANPPIIVSNCIEADLRAAVSQGGTIRFDCDGIIKLSTNLVIARDTIIDGTGHDVTISGAGDTRGRCTFVQNRPSVSVAMLASRLAKI